MWGPLLGLVYLEASQLRYLPTHQWPARRIVATGSMWAALSVALAACGVQQRDVDEKTQPRLSLAVLAGAPTPDSTLPVDIAASLVRSQQPRFNSANVRDARRVLANDPGWLLPAANGELCLVRVIYPLVARSNGVVLPTARSLTCASEAKIQAGRLVDVQALLTSGTKARESKVVGVAPNRVSTVTIISRDGRRLSVVVRQGAYEAVVANPIGLSFTTRHRGRPEKHVIPLTTFSGQSATPQPGSPAW